MKVASLYKRECGKMKKLICAADIEALHKEGKKCLLVTKQTIITPSAKDLAEEYQIVFQMQAETEGIIDLAPYESISKEGLVSLLRQLVAEAGINQLSNLPFAYEKHTSGLKIVKGTTVKLNPVQPDNPRIRYQELITPTESRFSGGILEIEESSYYDDTGLESLSYVIDGELQLTIAGTTYTANQGDTIFIPENQAVSWSTPNKVTILCGKLKGVGKE
jgi:ethanolamine utilization protein EutQ